MVVLPHFQLERIVCILKVMSCDGAVALIGSSVTLVPNGSLEHPSWEKSELRGQCLVMSRVICQLIISSEALASNSCNLQTSEP